MSTTDTESPSDAAPAARRRLRFRLAPQRTVAASAPLALRLAFELLVVFAGVYGAFALDGHRARQEQAEREQVYLRQLVADLTETERRLAAAVAEEEQARATTTSLLSALEAGAAIPPDSLRGWMMAPRWPFWYADPRFVMGTITALQQTGDLKILRSDSVRVAVSAYASDMEAEWLEFGRYVDESVRLMGAFHGQGSRAAGRAPVALTAEQGAAQRVLFLEALRRGPELGTILTGVQLARGNRLFYLRRMREATERLRRVIEASLQPAGGIP